MSLIITASRVVAYKAALTLPLSSNGEYPVVDTGLGTMNPTLNVYPDMWTSIITVNSDMCPDCPRKTFKV